MTYFVPSVLAGRTKHEIHVGDTYDKQICLILFSGAARDRRGRPSGCRLWEPPLTEIPGIDLSELSPEQKTVALQRLNADRFTCGCDLTLAYCIIDEEPCPREAAVLLEAQEIV